jgi:hypothetical protein
VSDIISQLNLSPSESESAKLLGTDPRKRSSSLSSRTSSTNARDLANLKRPAKGRKKRKIKDISQEPLDDSMGLLDLAKRDLLAFLESIWNKLCSDDGLKLVAVVSAFGLGLGVLLRSRFLPFF